MQGVSTDGTSPVRAPPPCSTSSFPRPPCLLHPPAVQRRAANCFPEVDRPRNTLLSALFQGLTISQVIVFSDCYCNCKHVCRTDTLTGDPMASSRLHLPLEVGQLANCFSKLYVFNFKFESCSELGKCPNKRFEVLNGTPEAGRMTSVAPAGPSGKFLLCQRMV